MKDSQCVSIMLKQDFTLKPHTLVRLGQYSQPIENLFRKVVSNTHSKTEDFGKKFEKFLKNSQQMAWAVPFTRSEISKKG